MGPPLKGRMLISSTANVSPDASVDASASIWDYTKVREGAIVGEGTSIGIGAYVGPGAVIGRNCKIQNGAQVYEPAIVEDGVFIGPRVVFTNDRLPRAVRPDGTPKSADDWTPVGVHVRTGAAIGAGSVCVAPLEIGAWAMVAAGSVVVRSVPAHALVAGVPARQLGWVDEDGTKLEPVGEAFLNPHTGCRYILNDRQQLVREIDD